MDNMTPRRRAITLILVAVLSGLVGSGATLAAAASVLPKQGPAGAQGPQGRPGETGPRGEPGPAAEGLSGAYVLAPYPGACPPGTHLPSDTAPSVRTVIDTVYRVCEVF